MNVKIPHYFTRTTNHVKLQATTQRHLALYTLLITCLFSFTSQAQDLPFLNLNAGPDVTIPCGTGGCTDLTANFKEIFETDNETYTVESIPYNPPFPFDNLANPLNPNIDDAWSEVDQLPFDFCFFGNLEQEFQVGSNGVIRFDVDPNDTGAGSNDWSFSDDLPNNADDALGEANVFTPVHDIDPAASTTEEIGYEVIGNFPNRVLVVSYFEVPLFSSTCNSLLATQMVVFYEFSNTVEVYIRDKPTCPSWQNGVAAIGIQNNDGTVAYVPPGRNTSDSPWTTSNEAWRFSPDGDPSYVFEWLDESGTVIGTDPTINVCPPTSVATYTARVTYTNSCNGETVVYTDDVVVTNEGGFTVDLGEDQTFCDVDEYEIVPELTGDTTNATYLWSPGGETTPTITVSTSGTYSVEVTVDSCTQTDDVTLTFLSGSECTIDPVCTEVDFEENFGTGTGRVCIDPAEATTTYTCNQQNQIEDGEYTITNISDGLNTGWHVGMEDHTEGDTDGRAFFVNADFNPGEFYRRTITLSPNGDYAFSAWITTLYDTDTGICGGNSIPSNVIFRIEDTAGNLIEETNTGDIPNGPEPNWQEFFINFNTGSNTDIQLVLINNSIGGCGNDLAIDDITLSLINPQPIVVTPNDLTACDDASNDETEVFDLESQIPTILDGQDPADFTITFHTSLFDAEADQNAIDTSDAYTNVSNPETIYVRVEKANDPLCFSTVSFDLIVNEVIDFTTNLPNTLDLCSTDTIPELDATPTNEGIDLSMVAYEWVDENNNVVSSEATFTPPGEGSYTVTLTLDPCSQSSFTIEVTITDTPTLDLGMDESLCDGESFEIVPTVGGNTDGITYLWSTGETTPTIIVDESGDYTLDIMVGPCVVSDTINVFISDPLEVDLGADFKVCPDEVQVLTATVEGENVTYQWFLNGDEIPGETGNTLEITVALNTMGTQTYTVIAANGDCTGEDSIDIQLYDVGNCTISQGLSPNGSPGFNDTLDLEFLADRSGIEQVQIFNRLGTLIYEKTNYINEWRGQSMDGNDLPTGTYFYVIDFASEDPLYGMQASGWIYLNQEAN